MMVMNLLCVYLWGHSGWWYWLMVMIMLMTCVYSDAGASWTPRSEPTSSDTSCGSALTAGELKTVPSTSWRTPPSEPSPSCQRGPPSAVSPPLYILYVNAHGAVSDGVHAPVWTKTPVNSENIHSLLSFDTKLNKTQQALSYLRVY